MHKWVYWICCFFKKNLISLFVLQCLLHSSHTSYRSLLSWWWMWHCNNYVFCLRVEVWIVCSQNEIQLQRVGQCIAVFIKACVGETEALRYSFGCLIASVYSGPLKGAIAAFGCGLWWLIWILCAERFLLCEEIGGKCCFLLGASLYHFDLRRRRSPGERCIVLSSQAGELNSIGFTKQINPLSFNEGSGLCASLRSCCVSRRCWSRECGRLCGGFGSWGQTSAGAGAGRGWQGFSCMIRGLSPYFLE